MNNNSNAARIEHLSPQHVPCPNSGRVSNNSHLTRIQARKSQALEHATSGDVPFRSERTILSTTHNSAQLSQAPQPGRLSPALSQNRGPNCQQQPDKLPSPVRTGAPCRTITPNPTVSPSTLKEEQTYASRSSCGPVTRPHKRQRLSVKPFWKEYIHAMNEHLENIDPRLERPQYQLLKDACDQKDVFYLFLHRTRCLWDLDQSQVTSILAFPSENVLRSAFNILGILIGNNGTIGLLHEKCFVWFSTQVLASMNSESPQPIASDISTFLWSLASDWAPFSLECVNRNYPPRLCELVDRLRLLSPVLQKIVFTVILHKLPVRDDLAVAEMEATFKKDQQLTTQTSITHPTEKASLQETQFTTLSRVGLPSTALLSQRPVSRPSHRPVDQRPKRGMAAKPPALSSMTAAESPSTKNRHLNPSVIPSTNTLRPPMNQSIAMPPPRQSNFQKSPVPRSTSLPDSYLRGRSPKAGTPRKRVLQMPKVCAPHQPILVQHQAAEPQEQNQSRPSLQVWAPREVHPQHQPIRAKETPIPANIMDFDQQSGEHIANVPSIERQQSQCINTDNDPHEAYLRDSGLTGVRTSRATVPPDHNSRRYYRAVSGFVIEPQKVNLATAISRFEFSISEQTFLLIAPSQVPSDGHPEQRGLTRGTPQCRIRCVKRPKEALRCDRSEFVVSDTFWPENSVLTLNQYYLRLRPDSCYTNDFSIDITSYLRAGSPSVLHKVELTLGQMARMHESSLFFGIEIVEIFHHQQIIDKALERYQPAEQTIDSIKKYLSINNDENGFSIATSELCINLVDPFTAQIFEIPARGSRCLHIECFDLETFLLTRNAIPQSIGEPCMVDVWKCPLCGQDVRPSTLVMDDFLASVRADLIKRGDQVVKAIMVGKDGKWRPKEAIRTRKSSVVPVSDSEESINGDENPYTTLPASIQTKSGAVEAIEIYDD